ncbi:MAG: carbohydrate kinase family protein [Patescibacteria group bacterium]
MNFPGYFKDNILPDKIHNLNVSFNIDKLEERYGGTAGNIAYNLSLLSLKSIIIGSVGKDFDKYKKYLEEKNIDVSGIKIAENDFTAAAYIITDKANNQITGFHMGAMAIDTDYEIKDGDLLIISPGNIHDMLRYQDQAQKINMPYIFDPGQTLPFFQPEELKALVRGAKVLITNDYELDLVIKKTGYTKEQILEIVEILVTTKGENGSTIQKKNVTINIPCAKTEHVLDPTGAGDAYRAGFIYGLLNNQELEICGQLGAVSAVYAVEKYGTQEHEYNMAELNERYKKNLIKK